MPRHVVLYINSFITVNKNTCESNRGWPSSAHRAAPSTREALRAQQKRVQPAIVAANKLLDERNVDVAEIIGKQFGFGTQESEHIAVLAWNGSDFDGWPWDDPDSDHMALLDNPNETCREVRSTVRQGPP